MDGLEHFFKIEFESKPKTQDLNDQQSPKKPRQTPKHSMNFFHPPPSHKQQNPFPIGPILALSKSRRMLWEINFWCYHLL